MAGGLDVVEGERDETVLVETKVERMTPVTVLPYSDFSPYAPYASCTARSGSESSGNVRLWCSAKVASSRAVVRHAEHLVAGGLQAS